MGLSLWKKFSPHFHPRSKRAGPFGCGGKYKMAKWIKGNKNLMFFFAVVLFLFLTGIWLFKKYLPALIEQVYFGEKDILILRDLIKRNKGIVIFPLEYYLLILRAFSGGFSLIVFLAILVFGLSYKNKKFYLPKLSLETYFPKFNFILILFFLWFSISRYVLTPNTKYLSLFLMVLSFLFFYLDKNSLFSIRLLALINFLTRTKIALPATIFLNLFIFFEKFPLSHFNSLVFFDDYPQRFAFILRGLEIFKQKAIFGWDSKLIGGYPTALEVADHLYVTFFPFSLFGEKIGFHLMLLFFWLLFPCIIYLYTLELVKKKKIANLALYVSTFFNFTFFINILAYGMINNYLAINLFISALFFTLRLKSEKKFSFFSLFLSLFLLMYCHEGIFIFALFFVGLEMLFPLKKQNVLRFAILITLLFSSTLNYGYYFLKYPSFFNLHIIPQTKPARGVFNFSLPDKINLGLLDFWNWNPSSYLGISLIFLPLLIWLIIKRPLKGIKRPCLYLLLLISTFFLHSPTSVGLLVSRGEYFMPFFLTVIFSAALFLAFEKRNLAFLFLLCAIFINFFPFLRGQIAHLKDIKAYNPSFISKIEKLKGVILFEEAGRLIRKVGENQPAHSHIAALLSQTLKVSLLSNTRDGYHPSIFRNNALQCGIFQDRLLTEIETSEFNNFLEKWAVRYIVVWSNISRNYLGSYPNFYEKEWEDKDWAIFRYIYAQVENLKFLSGEGEGELENLDYFLKVLEVRGAKESDTVILKTNYFPEWKAFYKNTRVPIFNYNGQLAINLPFEGEGEIIFKYPKHYFLSFLIFLSFACVIIVDRKIIKGEDEINSCYSDV
jgi:hypothetical protein